MTLRGEPEHFPRMPDQQADIMISSPLAVIALFIELARERFRVAQGLPWVWEGSPTPRATETGDTTAPRRIVIEGAWFRQAETHDPEPAIYASCGDIAPTKIVVDHRAGQQLSTGLKGYYAPAQIPILYEVLAADPGESMVIADTLWFFILAGIDAIRATFGIHDVTSPVLGPVAPDPKAKTLWRSPVSFTIQTELRWTTVPIAPLLREVVIRMRQTGTPIDEYLLEQHIRGRNG